MKVRGIALFLSVVGAMQACDGRSHSLGRPGPSAGTGSGGESGAEHGPGGESGVGGSGASAGTSGAISGKGGGTSGSAGRGGGSGGTGAALGGEAGEPPSHGGSSGVASGQGGSSGAATSGSGGAGVETWTVRKFVDARWAALCHLIFQCTAESDTPITFARALYGTETRCLELVTRSPNGNEGVADLIETVGEGRAILMPEHVPACLEALARCDRLVNSQPADAACRRVFAGTKQTGEACYREEECAGGGQCHVYDACPGICEPRPTIGEDCGYDIGSCDDSDGHVACLSGEDLSQPPTCEAVTLLPPAGEGEPCWAFASKDRETAYCAEGLWCQGDGYFDSLEPRTGICRGSLIPGGDPCNGWDICEEGYGCAADDVCRSFSIVGDGAPCDDDLVFCDIMQRLECVEGFCRSFGDGTEGSRCVTWDNVGFLPCNQGLVCVATTAPSEPEQAYACLPPLAPGENCLRDRDCASEACNDEFRCEPRFCEESYFLD